jgi:clan AA aspartic protease (TIGR02281 family)
LLLLWTSAAQAKEREPPVSPTGGDASRASTRWPGGVWVPIEAPMLGGRLEVRVVVNGRDAVATIDTGADHTTMDLATATRLGIVRTFTPAGEPLRIRDANANVIKGERLPLGTLAIGAHRWADVSVDVIDSPHQHFLIGMEILETLDLLVVANEGVLGLFDARRAPIPKGATQIKLVRERNKLIVDGHAPSTKGRQVPFFFYLDTGAMGTSVPVAIGIKGGLPAHIGLAAMWSGVSSTQERRGAFVLDPLRLGGERLDVGPLLATGAVLGGGQGRGLLGMDVMSTHVTMISPARSKMWLVPAAKRPAYRTRGPGIAKCKDNRCLEVAIAEQGENLGVGVIVDKSFHGRVVELAIVLEDARGRPLLNGNALNFIVTPSPQGYVGAVSVSKLRTLGVDGNTRARLAWVRTEGVSWPCDALATHCVLWPSWMGAIVGD